MEGSICEVFLLNLKCENQFLILFFEVGRHRCNPEYLSRSPSHFLLWAMTSAGSLHEDMEEGNACSVFACSCSSGFYSIDVQLLVQAWCFPTERTGLYLLVPVWGLLAKKSGLKLLIHIWCLPWD